MAVRLGEAFVEVVAKDDKLKSGLATSERTTRTSVDRMQRDIDSLSFSSFAAKAAPSIAGIFAGAKIVEFGSDVIDVGKTIQGLDNSFKAITGSAAGSRAEMAFLRAETDRLGQNTLASAQALKMLQAASIGTTMAGQGVRAVFSAFSEEATVLGLSQEKTAKSFEALTQMISKQKVRAEELTGQLAEHMPRAMQDAARAMGTTTAGLLDMAQKGELLAVDLLPRMAAMMSERNAGSVAEAAKQATAATNRWDNAVMELKASLAKEALPVFTEVVTGLTEVVKSMAETEKKTKDTQRVIDALAGTPDIDIAVNFDVRLRGTEQIDQFMTEQGIGKGQASVLSVLGRIHQLGMTPITQLPSAVDQALKDAFISKQISLPRGGMGWSTGRGETDAGMWSGGWWNEAAAARFGQRAKQLDEFRKIVEKIHVPVDELKETIAALDAAYKADPTSVPDYAAKHEYLSKQLEKAEKKSSGAAKAAKGLSEAQREGQRIMQEIATPAEKYQIELQRLDYWYRYGAITAETYARAVGKIRTEYETGPRSEYLIARDSARGDYYMDPEKARWEGMQGAAERATQIFDERIEAMVDKSKSAARTIQGYLGDGLYSALKGDFQSIGDAFLDMLLRMIADAAAAQLSRAMFGNLISGGTGSGLLGAALTSIVGWFSGGGSTAGGGVGTTSSGQIYRHAKGDYWFTEPTAAVGLRTGKRHMIAEAGQPEYLEGPNPKRGTTVVQPKMSVRLIVDPNLKLRAEEGPTRQDSEGWVKDVHLRALVNDEGYLAAHRSFIGGR